jgi:hypothetical protein
MARAQRRYIGIKKKNGQKALLPDLLNALPYLTGFGSKTFIEEDERCPWISSNR